MADIRQRTPFFRWLVFMLIVNAMIAPMWWLFNAAFHIFTSQVHWFLLVTVVEILLAVVGLIYTWIRHRTPETTKIKVGNAHEITAVDHIPGKRIITVEVPEGPDPDSPKEPFFYEAILGGGHAKVAETFSRQGKYVFFLRCFEIKDEKTGQKTPLHAGVMKGTTYVVDRQPKPYLKGDAINYRYVDWGKIASDIFGSYVHDTTLLIIGDEPLDPVTYAPPATKPGIEHELYMAVREIKRLQNERLDTYKEDKKAKRAKRDEVTVSYEGPR